MTDELKTRDQENHYHALLEDIARQCKHLNEHFDKDDWKRLCVDMFRKDCIRMGDQRLCDYWKRNGFRLVPSLDGSGLVALGSQTRKFPKYVATAFIEWLLAWGAEREVSWSDPREIPLEAYAEDARRAA
jgi:hypothetical protein